MRTLGYFWKEKKKLIFAHKNMKKLPSKVAHNQPKYFHYYAELPIWSKLFFYSGIWAEAPSVLSTLWLLCIQQILDHATCHLSCSRDQPFQYFTISLLRFATSGEFIYEVIHLVLRNCLIVSNIFKIYPISSLFS